MSGAGRRFARQPRWSPLLMPLVPFYAAALAVKNEAYTRGWLPVHRLEAAVISVGNLSVGGAGKTPLVIRLAELLAARGYAVDVLSRGYGRQAHGIERVRPHDEDAAVRFGDEPVLIARAALVPVYVGASRYAAGIFAEQDGEPFSEARVHLLDDGLQHRQLARSVDIVVLHRSDFTASLLPAGRLREPLGALRRASIAVLREEDADLAPEVQHRFPRLALWKMTREILLPSAAADRPAVAFCGIAHPQEFFASLQSAGARLAEVHTFRDHHAYSAADIEMLMRSVRATGAQMLLTTEKDLVRLSARHQAVLASAAVLAAAPLRARLFEEDAAIVQLLSLAGLRAVPTPGVPSSRLAPGP